MFKRYFFLYIHIMLMGACTLKQVQLPAIVKKQEPIIFLEPPLVTVGGSKITKLKFENEIKQMVAIDTLDPDAVLEQYLDRKMLAMEAVTRGIDTLDLFEEELETYRKIYLQTKNFDPKDIEELEKEAYQFYKRELRASHIFIPLSKYASETDTLKVYNDLLSVKKFAEKNNNFEVLAKQWSQDSKTKNKGGDLGWFSVFNLIYPLEKVLFGLAKESISAPVRTKYGYHLIKLNDSRPNSGQVRVKHLYKYVKEGDSAKVLKQIDSIRNTINNDASFNSAVRSFSDDYNTNMQNGELPVFSVGTREESLFEELAFGLKEREISNPIKIGNGYHIVKLIEKIPMRKESEFRESFKNKIVTDSRADFLKEKYVKRLSEKFHVKINQEILEECYNYADSRVLNRKWSYVPNAEILGFSLMQIGTKRINVKTFFDYVAAQQIKEKFSVNEKPEAIFKYFFKELTNKLLLEMGDQDYFKHNQDAISIFEKIKEDLLISKLNNQYVIEKSIMDTVGLMQFYNKNQFLFETDESASVAILRYNNKEVFKKYKLIKDKGKPFQLYRGFKPLYFPKNQYELGKEEGRFCVGLINVLAKNPGYQVEIAGHTDISEDEYVSEKRIKAVTDLLVASGMPLTKITELNQKSTKIADRFDWSKNQRVTFQFFSNFESDLVKSFNERHAGDIEVQNYNYTKAEFEKKWGLKWANQIGYRDHNGKPEEYAVKINQRKKSFKEVKYEVIGKYKNHLERELLKDARRKYKVELDKNDCIKTIKNLK